MADRSYPLLSGRLHVPDDGEPYIEYQTGYRPVRMPAEFVRSEEEEQLTAILERVVTYLGLKFGMDEDSQARIKAFVEAQPSDVWLSLVDDRGSLQTRDLMELWWLWEEQQ